VRIAIPNKDGNVEPCFEQGSMLRVYDIQNRIIIAVYDSDFDCSATPALVEYCQNERIDGIICGKIADSSCEALIAKNIAIYSGAEGTCDAAIDMLLNGDVIANEDEYPQGEPIIEGKNAGKYVSVHYVGTFDDGSVFDSSYDRGEPLGFRCGYGLMIPGFENAVVNMEEGEKVEVHLEPAQAYGEYNPAAVVKYAIDSLPGLRDLKVGDQVSSSVMGQTTIMTVIDKDDEAVTFDSNHEMAGKSLNFTIELLEIRK